MSTTAYKTPGNLRPGEIVGVSLQNAGKSTLPPGVATFGQAFAAGDLPAGATLLARVGDALVPVQMDVKTTHPDGSVRMAVLSVERPALSAGASLDLLLARGPAAAEPPALDLARALSGHSFTVELKGAGLPPRIDVLDALKKALADGSASLWQAGPLATQARVEIPLEGSMRLVFDVTAFKGGGFEVEAGFNNDVAMGAKGGRVKYEATVRMDGKVVAKENLDQGQYQNWHANFSSDGRHGGQGLGDPKAGWLNVRHDAGYLAETGAVAHYDTSIPISETLLQNYGKALDWSSWGKPLATHGVTPYMPTGGNRPDIGVTTGPNTSWLMSGDPRAAAYALGQAEAAGAVPWHFWDEANGTWLNTDHYPKLWTDGRGGTGRPGDSTSRGLTQQIPHDTGWGADRAHQPDLSFVPYLLTGERWILDNLQAQSVYTIMHTWPAYRGSDNVNVIEQSQIRSAAWSMRQIQNAAWASPDGSEEKAYFQAVEATNWAWLVSKIPQWTALQGETHGWLPTSINGMVTLSNWQQDYFASSAIAAASRGNQDAMTFLNWQSNYLIGRFFAEDEGFAFRDGAAYRVVTGENSTGRVFKTWQEMGDATRAWGWSNGTDSWTHSDGDYARLALMTLAGLYHLTGDERAAQAYERLLSERPPHTSESTFSGNPNHAITIPEIFDAVGVPIPPPKAPGSPSKPTGNTITHGTNGDDDVVLAQPITNGARVDLGAGDDRLTLSSAGNNRVTVANVETIIGGSRDDDVTLATAMLFGTVDLGEGRDRLTLGNVMNVVVVRNVETIIGGTGPDTVVLDTPGEDLTVDLKGGMDRLVLSSAGNNKVRVSNVEVIQGGVMDDEVILQTAAMAGTYVDLDDGYDRLVLSSAGNNVLTVLNVETIIGGSRNDDVTLGAALVDGYVDLGGGNDSLTLSSLGPNLITVKGVETLIGGDLTDEIVFAEAVRDVFVDLRGGDDTVNLSSAGNNRLTLRNVENVYGGSKDDEVTLATAVVGGVVDLGGGRDRLNLSSAGNNRLTVTDVETLHGGSRDDDVTLGAAAWGMQVDLGGGFDRLTLSSAGNNRVFLRNVEAVIGGSRDDEVTLGPARGVRVDLGAGNDRLILSSEGHNQVFVRNVETVLGGSKDDDVVLETAIRGGTVNLGAGNNRLSLASDGDNQLSVTHVQTIQGGAMNDAVFITSQTMPGAYVDLGDGYDRLTLSSLGPNRITVANVESIAGGSADDHVTLATAAQGVTVDLKGGRDTLVLSSAGNNRVTAVNTELVIGGDRDDHIAVGSGGVRVEGGRGRDTIVGGSGNDTLIGGHGADVLFGGAGRDRFVYQHRTDSVAGSMDAIMDFRPGEDLLVFEGLLQGGRFAYRADSAFTRSGHSEARFDNQRRELQLDLDGDGRTDMLVGLFGMSAGSLSAKDFAWS